MSEIYWITRLDLISGWLVGFAVISAIVTFIAIVAYICNRSDYEKYGEDQCKRWTEFSSKLFKISLPCFFAFCLSSILTPTTKEAMLIYGVDCYHNDSLIDDFLKCSVRRINNNEGYI